MGIEVILDLVTFPFLTELVSLLICAAISFSLQIEMVPGEIFLKYIYPHHYQETIFSTLITSAF